MVSGEIAPHAILLENQKDNLAKISVCFHKYAY